MIQDAEIFADEDKKVAERAVAKVRNESYDTATRDAFRTNWNNMSIL